MKPKSQHKDRAKALAAKRQAQWSAVWSEIGTRFLPFADAVSEELPLGRLMRLSLFQVSVGLATVLLTGTLNRVMIIELGVPASLVAVMIALPLVFAPLRALIGHRSDHHRSALGWRRGPFIWFGSMLMFGGLAIMPFSLILLSGDTTGPAWVGQAGGALAFLLVGAGLHTTQTAGLALATDIAPQDKRPQVVAVLYAMLLVGMVASALLLGALLQDFSQVRLIKTIQGCAALAMVLNMVALWKQEARQPVQRGQKKPAPRFSATWSHMLERPGVSRLLVATGLGAAAFSMQDVLLEPYGAEVLGLGVAATTRLTALFAGGMIFGFVIAGIRLDGGDSPYRLAGLGLLVGIMAFTATIFSGPLGSAGLFSIGTLLIGFGNGLFSVCTLIAFMGLGRSLVSTQKCENSLIDNGLALGAWGSVQACATGLAIFGGGLLRDGFAGLTLSGNLGPAFADPATAYSIVYHVEILLLFFTLAAIGPLARYAGAPVADTNARFGLAAFPG